jgi:hypothetical protein
MGWWEKGENSLPDKLKIPSNKFISADRTKPTEVHDK